MLPVILQATILVNFAVGMSVSKLQKHYWIDGMCLAEYFYKEMLDTNNLSDSKIAQNSDKNFTE